MRLHHTPAGDVIFAHGLGEMLLLCVIFHDKRRDGALAFVLPTLPENGGPPDAARSASDDPKKKLPPR